MWHLGFVIAMETIGFFMSGLSLRDFASIHKPHPIINMTRPPSKLSFRVQTKGRGIWKTADGSQLKRTNVLKPKLCFLSVSQCPSLWDTSFLRLPFNLPVISSF